MAPVNCASRPTCVVCAERRIVLCHAHHPDPAAERARREAPLDGSGAALSLRAALGHRAGAQIVVFGHSHMPMTARHDGVLLVNPGTVAPPYAVLRRSWQTAAVLFLRDDGAPCVTHIDLAIPDRALLLPAVDWRYGTRPALASYVESALAPELAADWPWVVERLGALDDHALNAVRAALVRLAHRHCRGELRAVGRHELLSELGSAVALTPRARQEILAIFHP